MSAARERVLRTAMELFHREGIRAVGVDRIAAEAGVSKMTLYRHFPAKDDLVVATLRARDAPALKGLADARVRAGEDPRAALVGPFDLLERWFASPGYRGCAFMNAALELADPDHPATKVVAEHKEATRDGFAAAARAAGAAEPGVLADQLAVLFDGAIAQSHVRDRAAVAAAARAAAHALTAGL